jgi:outer membrane protein assembly factor BamE (lipoprotein component of BamABCDE complex)
MQHSILPIMRQILQIFALIFLLSSCARTHINGQYVEDKHISQLQEGGKTQQDVLMMLGSPTFIAEEDSNIWYYVSRSVKITPLSKPNLNEQRIITITFDKEGKLIDIQIKVSNKNSDAHIESEASFTYGKSESGMQHFIKNFGRFNSKREKKR